MFKSQSMASFLILGSRFGISFNALVMIAERKLRQVLISTSCASGVSLTMLPFMELSEHEHQKRIIIWARKWRKVHPELRYLAAVPNQMSGGGAAWGSRRVAEGLSPGYPDLLLDYPTKGYHGLRIELKRPSERNKPRGGASPAQIEWKERLNAVSFLSVICYGYEEGIATIEGYLGIQTELTPGLLTSKTESEPEHK